MKSKKEKKEVSKNILKIIIIVLTFWLIDFVLHFTGVGETNYYYLSKFANAILFSITWVFAFNSKTHWKRLVFSLIFGTWVSFYYLVSSYSGLVQLLGISARYYPPVFFIAGIYFSPLWWWVIHTLSFYLGLELSTLVKPKSN